MRLPSLSRSALGPLLLTILIAWLIIGHSRQDEPRITPPWAVRQSQPSSWSLDLSELPELPELPDLPTRLRPSPQPMPDQVVERTNLRIASPAGLYAVETQEALASDLEWALAYVADRFGNAPAQPINVLVKNTEDCGLHGIAFTEQRQTQVYTCADIPRYRVVNILAHEFVHQLAHDRYGPLHLQADMILLEGLATWGAGDYWRGGQPSFREFVRHNVPADQRLPLATSYVGRSLADMNTLYYQWASFVEYLLDTYGRDAFDRLYVSGARAPGSANYQGVYSKDLATLEQEWQAWVGE